MRCKKCGESFIPDLFNQSPHCEDCERKIANNLKKYGLTYEEYETLLHTQNYRCAICDEDEMELTHVLHIDHDHTTGEVRGLLCKRCNAALGMFKDSILILTKAIQYLLKES